MTLDEYYKDIMGKVRDGWYTGDIKLHLYKDTMTSLPDFSSIKVKGDFSVRYCTKLQSLRGSPAEITGDYNCNFCDSLPNLEGCTQTIGGMFSCQGELPSLKGFPVGVDLKACVIPSRFKAFDVYFARNIKNINVYNVDEDMLYDLIKLLLK